MGAFDWSEDDLELLWQTLAQMFEHDRPAARGEMTTRRLYLLKRDSELGNAPVHTLFERIRPKLKSDVAVPRSFADYVVAVDDSNMPQGALLLKLA